MLFNALKKIGWTILLFSFCNIQAQTDIDSTSTRVKVATDIYSRYVWRGSDYFNSPCIQPDLQFYLYKNYLGIGTWGSFSTTNQPIQETDLYAFAIYKGFQLYIYDYFYLNLTTNNRYFDYKPKTTGHTLSCDISYTFSEKHPFTLLASYNFWGNDKQNSAYFELSYEFKKEQIKCFCGGTTSDGWYAYKAGICNIGISATKEIKVTETFTFPLKIECIVNPIRENIYLIAGISL